jgi:hypothetical protein
LRKLIIQSLNDENQANENSLAEADLDNLTNELIDRTNVYQLHRENNEIIDALELYSKSNTKQTTIQRLILRSSFIITSPLDINELFTELQNIGVLGNLISNGDHYLLCEYSEILTNFN